MSLSKMEMEKEEQGHPIKNNTVLARFDKSLVEMRYYA